MHYGCTMDYSTMLCNSMKHVHAQGQALRDAIVFFSISGGNLKAAHVWTLAA